MHVFTRPDDVPVEHKAPAMTESPALSEGRSPPLTSSLHSRHSASSAQEEAYLRKAVILKWTRFGLALIVTIIAFAAVGVSSHVLHGYNSTHIGNDWHLALWPINIDVRPTVATLIPAVIAAVGALVYIAFSLVPSPHSRFHVQNHVSAGIFIPAAIATLISIVFTYVVNDRVDKTGRDTIQSWTCMFHDKAREFAADTMSMGIPALTDPLMPSGYARACINSQAARWLMVALFVCQLLSAAVAVVGLISDKRINEIRDSRYHRNEKAPTV